MGVVFIVAGVLILIYSYTVPGNGDAGCVGLPLILWGVFFYFMNRSIDETDKTPKRGSDIVKIPHGGFVKRSTWEWMQKKDEGFWGCISLFFIIMLIIAFLQR
jgi:hypothetical protein